MRFVATAAILVAGVAASDHGETQLPKVYGNAPAPVPAPSYGPAPHPTSAPPRSSISSVGHYSSSSAAANSIYSSSAKAVPSSAPHVTYTTEVVTAITTFCPEPTTITHGTQTFTVTKATTLTITDCPCTVSRPVFTSVVVDCDAGVECPAKPTPTPVTPPVVQPPKPVTPPVVEQPKPVTPPVVEQPKPVTPPVVEQPKPVTPPVVEQPKPATPVVEQPKPVAPVPKPVTPAPPANTTIPIVPAVDSGASSLLAISGAGLAAIFAAAAYLL